jgi:SAM-dependent methyltransferase
MSKWRYILKWSKWQGLLERVRRTGFRRLAARTYRSWKEYLQDRYHDWRLGIDTLEEDEFMDWSVPQDDNHVYNYCRYSWFSRVIRYAKIVPDRDVFLDYGCGKGRALVLAAEHPFRRIIGVEYSAGLAETARENVRRALPKLQCREIEVVTQNAAEYEVPPEVTVVYLFNSFHGEIFRAVLDRLRASLEASPRELRIICTSPIADIESQMDGCPWLVKTVEYLDGLKQMVYEAQGVLCRSPGGERTGVDEGRCAREPVQKP